MNEAVFRFQRHVRSFGQFDHDEILIFTCGIGEHDVTRARQQGSDVDALRGGWHEDGSVRVTLFFAFESEFTHLIRVQIEFIQFVVEFLFRHSPAAGQRVLIEVDGGKSDVRA